MKKRVRSCSLLAMLIVIGVGILFAQLVSARPMNRGDGQSAQGNNWWMNALDSHLVALSPSAHDQHIDSFDHYHYQGSNAGPSQPQEQHAANYLYRESGPSHQTNEVFQGWHVPMLSYDHTRSEYTHWNPDETGHAFQPSEYPQNTYSEHVQDTQPGLEPITYDIQHHQNHDWHRQASPSINLPPDQSQFHDWHAMLSDQNHDSHVSPVFGIPDAGPHGSDVPASTFDPNDHDLQTSRESVAGEAGVEEQGAPKWKIWSKYARPPVKVLRQHALFSVAEGGQSAPVLVPEISLHAPSLKHDINERLFNNQLEWRTKMEQVLSTRYRDERLRKHLIDASTDNVRFIAKSGFLATNRPVYLFTHHVGPKGTYLFDPETDKRLTFSFWTPSDQYPSRLLHAGSATLSKEAVKGVLRVAQLHFDSMSNSASGAGERVLHAR